MKRIMSKLSLLAAMVMVVGACGTVELEADRGEQSQRGPVKADGFNSCAGHCDSQAPAGCWCDAECAAFGDCCPDKGAICDSRPTASCDGACGGQSPDGCWCDSGCATFGDCCPDVASTCSFEACTTDADCMEIACPLGGTIHATCEQGSCVSPPITDCPDVECMADSDCLSHESCINNLCVHPNFYCEADSDCPDDFRCVENGCVSAESECSADSDCVEIACPLGGMVHATCEQGSCVNPPITNCPDVECGKDTDCPPNLSCVNYTCG